ncbi:MAG: hypothetical protein N4A68_11855 [Maledivibacter sp.]|jgi:hypothetical protein|nr:hypothetical protein [Maledivibacter sp.]
MYISCCSRYKKCSDEGFCVNSDSDLSDNCGYRRKLEQGFNFYSDRRSGGSTYIKINDRLFLIGKRGSYGGYTYYLESDERKTLEGLFYALNIELVDKAVYSQCEVENVSDHDRACCKVILTLYGVKYNIMNFNVRALRESTAQEVRNFFREFGLFAATEYVGKKSTVPIVTKKGKVEKKALIRNRISEFAEQLSMF